MPMNVITVGGAKYRYVVSEANVGIIPPSRNKVLVNVDELLGQPHMNTHRVVVTPENVAEYIINNRIH